MYTHCKATIVSQKLIHAYEMFRLFVDTKLIITSGYRCQAHNIEVGGKTTSHHLAGEAIDIDAETLLDLYIVDRIKFIAKQSGFDYVQYYPKEGFFHMNVK